MLDCVSFWMLILGSDHEPGCLERGVDDPGEPVEFVQGRAAACYVRHGAKGWRIHQQGPWFAFYGLLDTLPLHWEHYCQHFSSQRLGPSCILGIIICWMCQSCCLRCFLWTSISLPSQRSSGFAEANSSCQVSWFWQTEKIACGNLFVMDGMRSWKIEDWWEWFQSMSSWQMLEKCSSWLNQCCKLNAVLWQSRTLISLLSDRLLREDFAML
jgi:hypothetical protein